LVWPSWRWMTISGTPSRAISTAWACRRCCLALTGLEYADSLVLDPHKWLLQPYEIGYVLVREAGLLKRTFALCGACLRGTPAAR
jgi:aromatic-L-amino-acid/L-tryptophan decarboxylase